MPTYYPQDNTQAFILALVVLIALIAMFTWLSGIYDLRNPLPYDEVEQPAQVLRDMPDQTAIAAQHCAKVNAKRARVRNG